MPDGVPRPDHHHVVHAGSPRRKQVPVPLGLGDDADAGPPNGPPRSAREHGCHRLGGHNHARHVAGPLHVLLEWEAGDCGPPTVAPCEEEETPRHDAREKPKRVIPTARDVIWAQEIFSAEFTSVNISWPPRTVMFMHVRIVSRGATNGAWHRASPVGACHHRAHHTTCSVLSDQAYTRWYVNELILFFRTIVIMNSAACSHRW